MKSIQALILDGTGNGQPLRIEIQFTFFSLWFDPIQKMLDAYELGFWSLESDSKRTQIIIDQMLTLKMILNGAGNGHVQNRNSKDFDLNISVFKSIRFKFFWQSDNHFANGPSWIQINKS